MRTRTTHGARRSAARWAAWVVAIGGAGTLVVVGLAGPAGTVGSFATLFVGIGFDIVVYATVGLLLGLRRPDNLVAALLQAAALMLGVTFLGFAGGAVLAQARGPGDPVAGVVTLGGATINASLVLAGPALAIVFPDGRLPGARWRLPVTWLAVVLVFDTLVDLLVPGSLGDGVADNPLPTAPGPLVDVLRAAGEVVSLLVVPVALGMALVAVVVRFRRADPTERRQLTWFIAANVLVAVFLGLSIAVGTFQPDVVDMLAVASLSLLPIAVGIAVTRYRLYEIDRIISRTLGWAIVTATLVTVFVGLVVTLQAVLASIADESALAVALSTLVAFALFQPLRRRVQRAVDRRFDRARYDGERTAADFAERLRDEVDLGRVSGELVAAAGLTMRPRSVDVWLRSERR